MLLKKTHNFTDGTIQTCFVLKKCKYCGRLFIKTANRQELCSSLCKHYSLQDAKAVYQRKRRRLIHDGVLISNENKKLGNSRLETKPKTDFNHEHRCIQYELKRLGLVSNK